MIRLDIKDYSMVKNPLRAIPFNTLFARAVVNGQFPGDVYVDDIKNPSSFYILHPYGMSLVFGTSGNPDFDDWLGRHLLDESRQKPEYLQVHGDDWPALIKEIGGSKYHALEDGGDDLGKLIIEDTRINFRFEGLPDYPENKNCQIVRTDEFLFEKMEGTVIPKFFWQNSRDFIENAVGFSALVDGELASTAFAAFVVEDKTGKYLEIGIETIPKFYGRGMAKEACRALINYCQENDYEPTWSCRGTNTGSKRLAESLGFKEVLRLSYWCIRPAQTN